MPDKRQTGTRYEQEAAAYLIRQGYRILETNYRTRQGEIDLIASSPEGVLVMVEVKYRRPGTGFDPLEAVDVRKQRHLSHAAMWYLMSHDLPEDLVIRFDVIGCTGDGQITHIKHAFDYKGRW